MEKKKGLTHKNTLWQTFGQMDFRASLPQWTKEAIWTAIVAAIVGIIFGELRHMIVTLIEHHQASLDRRVLNFLSGKAPGVDTRIEDLHRELGVRTKRIEASLHRLEQKQLAETGEMGNWHKVVRTKVH